MSGGAVRASKFGEGAAMGGEAHRGQYSGVWVAWDGAGEFTTEDTENTEVEHAWPAHAHHPLPSWPVVSTGHPFGSRPAVDVRAHVHPTEERLWVAGTYARP